MNNRNKSLISSIVLLFLLAGCSQQQVSGDASQVAGSSQQVAGSSQQVSPEQVSKECPECNAPKVEPVVVEKPTPPVATTKKVVNNPWTHVHPAVPDCTTSIKHTHKYQNRNHNHTYSCKKPAIDVSALQRKLKAKGYYKGPIDGVINAKTRSALKRYQQRRK